ncbi:MAG: M20/M25/M40 family metallo-hydrolase, partial [Erysipelotrichaceae bacterium]
MSIISKETYLHYFEEISKIPHGSGNEKQLSDYLCRFARERGLKLEQDKFFNVVIYKPASKGYENHKPVALQSHIDMVEESDNDYDFSKGLEIYEEDGYIKARDTTLGADDGIGVALMLAVLDDKTLAHPPIEAIFTTQEETTMEGAFKLKPEYIRSRRLINLDGETEGLSTTTSSGGIDVFFSKALNKENNSDRAYKLYITNLSGG